MVNRDSLRQVRASTDPRAALSRAKSPHGQLRTPRSTSRSAISKSRSTSPPISKQRRSKDGIVTPNTTSGGDRGGAVRRVLDPIPPPLRRLTSQRDIRDLPTDSNTEEEQSEEE